MAGTQGGVGRIAAMAIGLAVVLLLFLADAARAGTYDVAQCGWGVGVELDPTRPKTEGAAAYLHPDYCTSPPPGAAASLEFVAGLANDGEQGVARARWVAPPGTNFAGVRFTWSGALAYAVWHVAGIDDGTAFHGVGADAVNTPPHVVAKPVTGPAPAFEVRLECLILGAQYGCDRSVWSRMWLSGLTLTIDDPVPPLARLGGPLVASGWHRGTVPLEVGAEDPAGAGLYREGATVDGVPVMAAPVACAVATIEGKVRATRLRPCPASASQAAEVDTTAFADGVHALQGCAVDFGGGQGCAPTVPLAIDNSPPAVEFGAAPEGQVAATVSDPFSGPAAGTISVRRVDSTSWTDIKTRIERGDGGTATLRARLPRLTAGAYFFRAVATDGAGNSGSALFRAAGTAAELRRAGMPRPRGRATHLRARLLEDGPGGRSGDGAAKRGRAGRAASGPDAGGSELTVPFGSAVEVRGRLTDEHRDGVPDQPVAVVARAPAEVGDAPERRRVLTDRAGRFAVRLAPGTSRRVRVSFRGGAGFAPARGRPLGLRVRAAVSFAARPLHLRTGERVTLSGRVRPGTARIPARGKLVTVQYLERASGRWRPALVVRTGSRGRFKARYRFRYVTGAARIRLRATVLPEVGWPYAAGFSAPVTVRVRGGQTTPAQPPGAARPIL